MHSGAPRGAESLWHERMQPQCLLRADPWPLPAIVCMLIGSAAAKQEVVASLLCIVTTGSLDTRALPHPSACGAPPLAFTIGQNISRQH